MLVGVGRQVGESSSISLMGSLNLMCLVIIVRLWLKVVSQIFLVEIVCLW